MATGTTRSCRRQLSHVIVARRLRELESLGRRGNLNLVIGVLTTSIAVFLLAYMVLGHSTNFESLTALLSHYVPRVTIVVFIEVFSFFFLRLYRATLAEIRTYQTDLMALASGRVAVMVALPSSDPASRANLAKEMVSAARRTAGASDSGSTLDPKAIVELLKKFSEVVQTKETKGG